MEELLEWLRSALHDPQRLLVRLGVLWWIYSTIRGALRRRGQGSEAPAETKPPAPAPQPPTAAPPPEPRPSARPASGKLAAERGRRSEAARAGAPVASSRAPGAERSRRSDVTRPRSEPPAVTARADAAATLDAALGRAYALATRIRSEERLARLEPILSAEVQEPLQRARAQLSSASAIASELAASALRALELLARLVEERALDDARPLERPLAAEGGTRTLERDARSERLQRAEPLLMADAIAEAVHAPLRRYADAEGLRLRGRHPFATRIPLPASPRARGEQLLLLPVGRDFGAQLDDYVELLHGLGSRWFFALPKLAQDCNAQLDLAPRVRLPDPRVGYTEASARACFGPWLPALFGDLALTLRLGAGYVAGLVRSTADSSEVVRARSEGAELSHVPPVVLRVQVALTALIRLGEQRAAERLRNAFGVAHPALEQSYLPLADGRLMVLPTAYLLALTQPLAQYLLDSRQAALGGRPLAELPFVHTLDQGREQERLAARLAAGPLGERVDPAQLVGAALFAWEAGADASALLQRLHATLAPPRVRRSAPHAAERQRPDTLRSGPGQSLRAAFRDRRTLRRAVLIGAAFEPPRGHPVRATRP